jgi:hypothetical protein
MLFNLFAIAPLLERFEAEFGTIVTLSLFTGRKKPLNVAPENWFDRNAAFGLLPGGLYLILEKFVLRGNTTVMGARHDYLDFESMMLY